MTWLSLLLITKIGVTGLLVATPFMLLPKSKLEKSLNITTPTPVFFRLYGVAITALLVGYAFGIPAAEAGRFPWGVAYMGAVSNGGAAILLSAYSQGSKQNRVLGAFFGLIALGLITAMIMPASAMERAW
jgi:hypothetical protein